MKKYTGIIAMTFKVALAYRTNIFLKLFTNIFYVILTYFLWKSIYTNTDTLGNMSFNDTFLYLTIAGTILVLFQNWTEWLICDDIITGDVVGKLLKPYSFRFYWMFHSFGLTLNNALTITLPALVIVFVFFRLSITIGIHLLFFIPALFFAWMINALISYMTALLAFYTESTWGITATKDALVLFLSGAIVPLSFYPSPLKEILHVLPFQAIYNSPLKILVDPGISIAACISILSIQVFWIVVLFILSHLLFSRAIKVVTVNGG